MKDVYKHRSEDEHGNPDDLFTEKEALLLAKEQGVEFVDKFVVQEVFGESEKFEFNIRKKAEAKLKELDNEKYTIVQQRSQK